MEKVDSENKVWWDKYKDISKRLTDRDRGIMSVWSRLKGKRTSYDLIKDVTGFTEDEYVKFMDKLDEVVRNSKSVECMPGAFLPSVACALLGVPAGVVGFQISDDGNNYVVYASKKTVMGRYAFPKDMPAFISLKKYYDYFKDIIMIVRSEFKPGDISYNNRGIFKNPISFIEDGDKYPGLSMKLHGFSAAAIHHIAKNAQYMTVNPIAAMRGIIMKTKTRIFWTLATMSLKNSKERSRWSRNQVSVLK